MTEQWAEIAAALWAAQQMLEDGWPDDPEWFSILSTRLDALSPDTWRRVEDAVS
jgi:hypothetical protein